MLSYNSTYSFTVNEDMTIYAASTRGLVVNNFYREKSTWSLTSMGHMILKDHYTGKEVFRSDLSLFSGTNVELECGRYDWYKSLFGLEMPMINKFLRTAVMKRMDSDTAARRCPGHRMWVMGATTIIKLV